MAGLFKQRKPKRIVPSAASSSATSQAEDEEENSGPVVRRPGALKQKSKLRVAFDPDADTDQDASNVVEQQIDVAAKFSNSSRAEVSNKIHILTASEIAAAKARRARLAQEKKAEDFIPLDDNELYDSDGEFKPQRMQVGSYSYNAAAAAQGQKGTRLEHEDEDIMEGFDAFVEDGPTGARIQMDVSRRAERQRRKAEKEAMRAQIDAAEETDSEASGATGYGYDSDDGERHRAYEEAQFHAGLDGLRHVHEEHRRRSRRPKQPEMTTPIEKLAVGLDRLREQLQGQREHVQRALEESSRELERVQGSIRDVEAGQRGVESMGHQGA
ncbi:hypothetical protein DV737_g4767, partial [Chaetothyriales sp. CBS 132003]